MTKSSFKQAHEFEKRQAEASRIREKYSDRIPVTVEKAERSDIPNIDRKNLGMWVELPPTQKKSSPPVAKSEGNWAKGTSPFSCPVSVNALSSTIPQSA